MSELSKNKKLKKLYDYGDRMTPQKWAKAVDMLSPYSPPEDAPVIDTTYAEAKALYESGNMKLGVYYRFTYYHEKSMVYDNDADITSYTMHHTLPIYVFIDKYGDLKAKGSYEYNIGDQPNIAKFVADYTFDILAANIYNDEYSEYLVFKKELIYDEYGVIGQVLKKYNIPYETFESDYGDIMVRPLIPYVESNDPFDDSDILIFINGFKFKYQTDSYEILPNHVFNETGLLYNLDYGDYIHSYLFDAYNDNYHFIKLKGNINNKLNNHIFVNYNELYGIIMIDVKNCDIYISYIQEFSSLIYGINTFFYIDNLNTDLIYGDQYYNQTVNIGGDHDE